MTVNPIESGTGHVWQAKQSVQGTREAASATGMKHLRKAGDDGLKPAQTLGSEEWVDGQAFGSPTQYIDTVGGDVGTFTTQAQIETAGFQFAQNIGVDVVTGSADPYTHTIASGNAYGPLQTFYQQTGQSVGPVNMAFYDALVNTSTWNCGKDQMTAHLAQAVMALQAGEWFSTAPTATDSGTDPWNWNEVTGAATINGTPMREVDGDTLEITRNLGIEYGDGAASGYFIRGKGQINRTLSAAVTDNTITALKTALYGTATPSDGDAVSTAVSTVALKTVYTKSANRSLSIDTPNVVVDPSDFEVYPRAEGGKIPITFGGVARKVGSTPAVTIIAKTGDATSYV